ncbi:MAG: hypothetical protein ABI462_00640 [Ignavibacteria bacterium]
MIKLIVLMILSFLTANTSVFSQTWTVVPSPNPGSSRNFLNGVYAISSTDVWAVGVYDEQPSFTLTLHWDGVNWTTISSPNHGVQYNLLNAVKGLSSDNVYTVGYYSVIGTPQMLILHWDGSSWTEEATPTVTGGSSLQSIVMFGPDDIYAGGFRAVGSPGPTTGTLVTHWNGSSWNIEATPNQSQTRHNEITDMKGLSPNDIWAVGYSRNTGVGVGFYYQAMVLHKTASGWSVVPVPQSPADENFLYSIDIIAPDNIWASGETNRGGGYQTLFYHYNGSTWTEVTSPEGGYGFVHGSASDIWSTGSKFVHYDGSTWNLVSAPIPSGGAMSSMSRISSTDIWAVGRTSDGSNLTTLIMHFGSPSLTMNLKALIQGFYNPLTNKMVKDTARIYLRHASSPYSIVDSTLSILDSNGTGNFVFSNAVNSTPYYIVIKHRNGLETWSASGNSFTSGSMSYDFTIAASKAFGNNQFLKGSKYCIYNGDINHDGLINLTDIVSVHNNVVSFISGYVNTDLTGDMSTNLTDVMIAYNNSVGFVKLIRP